MAVMSPVEVFRTPRKHEGRIAEGDADDSYRAFEVLYLTFIAMPVIVGLGMASGTMVNWQRYLAPFLGPTGPGGHALIIALGWLAMALGVLVAANPLLGGQAATAWLWLGAINFMFSPGHAGLEVSLLTMSAASWTLAQLAREFGKKTA